MNRESRTCWSFELMDGINIQLNDIHFVSLKDDSGGTV